LTELWLQSEIIRSSDIHVLNVMFLYTVHFNIIAVGLILFVVSNINLCRLWGPPSLVYSGYLGSFLGDKAAGARSRLLTSI